MLKRERQHAGENPHRPWNTTNKGEGTLADTKNRNRVIASSGKAIGARGGDVRAGASGKLVSVSSIEFHGIPPAPEGMAWPLAVLKSNLLRVVIDHMDTRKLDLALLVTLEALMAERNVTRAARRLNLSQPALSARLARLREAFSDPLLVPAQRGMVLTQRCTRAAAALARGIGTCASRRRRRSAP